MKIRKPFLFFLRNLFLSHYHKTSTDIIHKSLLEGLSLAWTFLAFTDLYLIISWFLSGLKNKKQSWEEVQVSSLLVLFWETEAERFRTQFRCVDRCGSSSRVPLLQTVSLYLCKDKLRSIQSSLMLLQVIFQRMSSLSKHTFPLFLPPHISSFNLFLISYIREA